MPFKYNSGSGEVFFHGPDIAGPRNWHGLQDGYDYVIVDGYKNQFGKLEYSWSDEISYLCGAERNVITDFTVEQENTDNAQYLKLRHPNNGHYYATLTVKGVDAIKAKYNESDYEVTRTDSDSGSDSKSLDPIGVPHVDPRDTDYGVPDPTPSDPTDTRDTPTPGTVSADCMLEATLTPLKVSPECRQEFADAGIALPTPPTQNPLCGPSTGPRDLAEDLKNGCFEDNRLGGPISGPSQPIAPTLPGFPG